MGSPGLTGPTSDFFHQNYGNFRGLRERLRTILEPGPFLPREDVPTESEVVVHIRMWEGFGCGNRIDGCVSVLLYPLSSVSTLMVGFER